MAPRRLAPHSTAAEKENVLLHNCMSSGISSELFSSPIITTQLKRKTKKPLQPSNHIKLNSSLEEELEAMTLKLSKICMEKANAEKLLQESKEQLKQKEAELQLERLEQVKLEKKLRELQKKPKAFQPTIALPLPQNEHSKKKTSDPKTVKVKRPVSAYIRWCNEQRQQVREENPTASFEEMSATLGEKWKLLSEDEKKIYEEQYQAEKKVYLELVGQEKREKEALNLYREEQNKKTAMNLLGQYLEYKKEAEESAVKTKKNSKDPLKPKHPISAFFAFCNERRASLLAEKHSFLEIGKLLGEEWKNLTEEMRAPYLKIALQAKKQYAQDMESYKRAKAEEAKLVEEQKVMQSKIERAQALQLLKQKEKMESVKKDMKEKRLQKKKLQQDADPNRPKRPATSFLLFSKDARKKLLLEKPESTFSEITALISLKWKELTETEKKVWADKAAESMEQYKKDMEEYKRRTQGGSSSVTEESKGSSSNQAEPTEQIVAEAAN